MENFEVYPSPGAKYTAQLDEDAADGTWMVWSGSFYVGKGLDEKEAKKLADDSNLLEVLAEYKEDLLELADL